MRAADGRGQDRRVLEVVRPRRGIPAALGVTPLGGSPGATRSMPSMPLETMLLPRIESPVPDSTETPARMLKAIVFPAPETVPPIGVARRRCC